MKRDSHANGPCAFILCTKRFHAGDLLFFICTSLSVTSDNFCTYNGMLTFKTSSASLAGKPKYSLTSRLVIFPALYIESISTLEYCLGHLSWLQSNSVPFTQQSHGVLSFAEQFLQKFAKLGFSVPQNGQIILITPMKCLSILLNPL